MKCPRCLTGVLKAAEPGTNANVLVTCNNQQCFIWFTGTPGGPLIPGDSHTHSHRHPSPRSKNT